MTHWLRPWKRLMSGFLAIASSLAVLPVCAETVLESPKEPVQVELKTTIDLENARFGDSFEAVIPDAYSFEQKQLPAGTVLSGTIKRTRLSRTLAMPGYVELDIEKATFPSGQTYDFEKDISSKKIMHEDAVTARQIGKSALPFTLISAADAIPLKYAAGMSSWIILPISLGARMVLGAALEHTKGERRWHEKRQHRSASLRYGHGVLRGTGLTGVYYLLHPSPNPDLAAGKTIPVHFSEEALNGLFAAGEQAQAALQEEQGTASLNGKLLLEESAQSRL